MERENLGERGREREEEIDREIERRREREWVTGRVSSFITAHSEWQGEISTVPGQSAPFRLGPKGRFHNTVVRRGGGEGR
jgi:hypothetical protein